MDNDKTKTASFTFTFFFYTLLVLIYTVSAGRPAAEQPLTVVAAAGGSKNILLPGEKDDAVNLEAETGNKPTINDDLSVLPPPRRHTANFTRYFHPINRHFQGRPKQTQTTGGKVVRRPNCVKHSQYMIPPSTKTSFRGEVPSSWLKAKHHYGGTSSSSRNGPQENNENYRGRNQQQNNNNNNNNNNKKKKKENNHVMKTRNHVFDREKMNKSLRRQQKKNDQLKSGDGFMKDIRKFLKHTFD